MPQSTTAALATAPPAGPAATAGADLRAGVGGAAPRPVRRRDPAGHRNEVVVAGRITAEPAVRELPSGDRLTSWRVSIARPPSEQRPNQASDPITCVSFQTAIEHDTRDWRIGDTVQVSGALRRRFWRSAKGSASVVEIEARHVRRLARAEPSAAAGEPARPAAD
ncbi:single-stranded DNA-binding protein [Streptomonospora nanhaiensis]|uniref:Single-stranded DNA-binding protein n=1 Tax=Streptomonospora nanhaiensis TaxID=1323731 RepID=A0A853BV43_9ACTN|nr:single-stranded DNA-binding protein [Streptomonospora nanhaiensis]MBV2365697.1 single-stranded DNA-binding protein [Streptomonospora nanhaiensis]MBX9391448.1 single-stranded DNA-binding protein [Streptomonospora nanhaiensis]NYI98864.1 single-stranded DNA-binding protein [Streptomonospora nanhaiensis]